MGELFFVSQSNSRFFLLFYIHFEESDIKKDPKFENFEKLGLFGQKLQKYTIFRNGTLSLLSFVF
jgi:hypothetical protein